MKSYPFKKLDAFATATSSGNPAGAVYLDSFDAITDAEMQRIARELKGFVSEVGFVAPIAPDAFRLRYFSAEKEVQFCGHATIAIGHDLVRQQPALTRLQLHTNKGLLPLESREGSVYIQAPEPVYTECRLDPLETAAALGLPVPALEGAMALVNAGNQTLCLGLKTLRDVVSAAPDLDRLKAFCHRHGVDVVAVFTEDVADPGNRLRTRVFAAPFGYLEDPATGSGNAALAYFLHQQGRWDGAPFRIEQNADLERPNLVCISSSLDAEGRFRVSFGGGAILRIEGRYWI